MVAPIQLLLTMAWPIFEIGSFCTLVTLESRTATVGGLSFRSRSLMGLRGRVSVKLLKTGRIRIAYLEHSDLVAIGHVDVLPTLFREVLSRDPAHNVHEYGAGFSGLTPFPLRTLVAVHVSP